MTWFCLSLLMFVHLHKSMILTAMLPLPPHSSFFILSINDLSSADFHFVAILLNQDPHLLTVDVPWTNSWKIAHLSQVPSVHQASAVPQSKKDLSSD